MMGSQKQRTKHKMKTFILIISPAWPSKTGKREHSAAVKALKEIGWHKMAPNTFRGAAKSAESFEKMMKGCVPHAANWRLHEVACDHLMCGKDWPREASKTQA